MPSISNIMSIDLEDWFVGLDIGEWSAHEHRVTRGTEKLLALLGEEHVTATFFILGYVAEHFPALVEKIRDEGHEIASHGYSHTSLLQQTPAEFEDDLGRSLEVLRGLTGDRITGYRAPHFSLVEKTAWAVEIITRCGFRYDSSIFPVRTHMYGVPDAPLLPYPISSADIKKPTPGADLLELPLSVYRLAPLRKNLPVAGGVYFRVLPYRFTSHAIRRLNRSGLPAVFYIHPWEFDPGHPRIDFYRWYHYHRLASTEGKFRRLLRDFPFTSAEDWIANNATRFG